MNPTMRLAVVSGVSGLVVVGGVAFVLFRETDSPPTSVTIKSLRPMDFLETKSRAEAGDAAAQCDLGEFLSEGRGVPPNFTEAVEWYRKAAEQGLARAQYQLGQLYDLGRGLTRDEAAAAEWYRKAAESGHAEAQYLYASMCSLGRGVAPNAEEALRWYRRAAEQGDALAMYNLAERHERARGVTENLEEAYFWHTLAADRGLPDAQTARKRLEIQLTSSQKKEAVKRVKDFLSQFGSAWRKP